MADFCPFGLLIAVAWNYTKLHRGVVLPLALKGIGANRAGSSSIQSFVKSTFDAQAPWLVLIPAAEFTPARVSISHHPAGELPT